MPKKPYPNPDFTPWKAEDQAEYLRYAREVYVRKAGDPRTECTTWRYWDVHRRAQRCPECPPPHKARQNLLQALYLEGEARGCLRLDFRQFVVRILKGEPHLYRRVGHHYISRAGELVVKPSSKYVRRRQAAKPQPTLKELERKQNRRDWREKKGFERDHQRPHWYSGSRKTFAKKCSNRLHRQWERRQIQREAWDDQISDVTKWTHDPWMWD